MCRSQPTPLRRQRGRAEFTREADRSLLEWADAALMPDDSREQLAPHIAPRIAPPDHLGLKARHRTDPV